MSLGKLKGTKARKPALPESDCCAIRVTLDRISDKWSLYTVGMLREGPMRFSELKRSIDGISQRMLTLTLRDLERDGLLTRTVYPTKPPSVEYQLTPLGHSLHEPVKAFLGWAQKSQSAIETARQKYDRANAE